MSVKFLVPEIDRDRWAEELREQIRSKGLKSKDLIDIGAETRYRRWIGFYPFAGFSLVRLIVYCLQNLSGWSATLTFWRLAFH